MSAAGKGKETPKGKGVEAAPAAGKGEGSPESALRLLEGKCPLQEMAKEVPKERGWRLPKERPKEVRRERAVSLLKGKCPRERAKELSKERALRLRDRKCPQERAKEVPKERALRLLEGMCLQERVEEVLKERALRLGAEAAGGEVSTGKGKGSFKGKGVEGRDVSTGKGGGSLKGKGAEAAEGEVSAGKGKGSPEGKGAGAAGGEVSTGKGKGSFKGKGVEAAAGKGVEGSPPSILKRKHSEACHACSDERECVCVCTCACTLRCMQDGCASASVRRRVSFSDQSCTESEHDVFPFKDLLWDKPESIHEEQFLDPLVCLPNTLNPEFWGANYLFRRKKNIEASPMFPYLQAWMQKHSRGKWSTLNEDPMWHIHVYHDFQIDSLRPTGERLKNLARMLSLVRFPSIFDHPCQLQASPLREHPQAASPSTAAMIGPDQSTLNAFGLQWLQI